MGPQYGDATSVGYELLHGQVTRAQGLFSPRSVINYFSLDYIAHNLDTPAVVLQYPSEKELVRELRNGYDYVGLSFVLSTFHRVKRMVALIRKHSPNSKIIIGGYGTVMSDEEIRPYGDFICREEGVAFIRRVLGEPVKPMPYGHPLVTNGLKVFSVPIGNNGMIFGGLGCPNGCDFCCTSHFFKRKHIKLLPEGDDIFALIQRYREKDPDIKFTVLDEDFLLNQKRARRLLELVRSSDQAPPSLFVFSSIRALSQYDIRELLEMGISGVWIGYEGTRSGYAKQKGREPRALFKEFRDYGINILASMVIGFDYQTPQIIREELNGLLELVPTFTQFLIYGPTPGTPFYTRIQQEGKMLPQYRDDRDHYYRRCTGFYGVVKHPSLSSRELESLQEECFQTDFKVLGPSIVRAVENWFLGYQKLIHDKSAILKKRAETYKQDIINALPVFLPAKLMGPTRQAREYAHRLYQQIVGNMQIGSFEHKLKSFGAVAMACWTALCLKMDWFQHPRLTRMTYRFGCINDA
ncbi:MAG: hypothetical protein A3G87_02670 [Omnitrophica bacterium RIFCSPLOWO2_12_FULL_50_11]|nr:MAG: hypothetical protein A3G87_02670 [Omnitrophica bacterium RIFCSPLOWO2_12_FULL_50_11]